MTSTTTNTWISSISEAKPRKGLKPMKFLRAGFWQKAVIALTLLLAISALWHRRHLDDAVYWGQAGEAAAIYLVVILFIADVVTEIYIINNDSPDVYKITWMFFVGVFRLRGSPLCPFRQ
jgi:hypothetical protein